MTDSLRDQLLGLGFKAAPAPKRNDPPRRGGRHDAKAGQKSNAPAPGRNARAGAPHKGGHRQGAQGTGRGKPRSQEDIDLAKAYAIRAQREKEERIRAEQAKQEEARKRREARTRLAELVKGKALNVEEADIARHFPYGGKIKRVYVTADQLKALNAGELGVLQMDGRYLLVTAALLAEAEQVFAPAVALKVDPDAPAEDDPYADPKYQVPDDLVW
ncbi:DUF2058 domain-containing protein [Novilysobacter spongiicola]|uniref:Uncharacterized conserved protein YaiL, DUF2058 family n=1 Tax=Lysobacter spongiicola DSM 21749 TaxID=1122188 RepID=A0A1T4MFU8_9GAMM|nr:DUF2058 family protein [Lysobacter spongiicola]SJZ65668.1 Uncharacterized conserved protein YaiL, DUF2058 family [Lysobacter spongiicola DSM 21749]